MNLKGLVKDISYYRLNGRLIYVNFNDSKSKYCNFCDKPLKRKTVYFYRCIQANPINGEDLEFCESCYIRIKFLFDLRREK